MQEIKVIIGASYGDEGKGLATDFFGARAAGGHAAAPGGIINVLTNGGPQRGHTVELPDGRRHVFKHFGAASFRGAASYYDRQFMVNPMEYIREYDELIAQHTAPETYMHPECRFTTPWDMLVNQMILEKRGLHNSCGFGIWETVLRYRRGWGLPFGTFLRMCREDRITFLRRLRDRYFVKRIRELEKQQDPGTDAVKAETLENATRSEAFESAAGALTATELEAFMDTAEGASVRGFFFSDELLFHFEEDCESMRCLCPVRDSRFLKYFPTVLFENAQGLLLDGSIKTEQAFTTPSTTGIGSVFQTLETVFEGADVEVCYVSRSYLTRHGDGSMENEIPPEQLRDHLPGLHEDKTNMENCCQGSLRYGMMDTVLLADRIRADYSRCGTASKNRFHPSVMVTHLNEHAGIDTAKLTDQFGTLYLSDGRTEGDVQAYRKAPTGQPRFCPLPAR